MTNTTMRAFTAHPRGSGATRLVHHVRLRLPRSPRVAPIAPWIDNCTDARTEVSPHVGDVVSPKSKRSRTPPRIRGLFVCPG